MEQGQKNTANEAETQTQVIRVKEDEKIELFIGGNNSGSISKWNGKATIVIIFD